MPENKYLNRRNFLKSSSLGMLGAGFSFKKSWSRSKDDVQSTENVDKPKVKEYRLLGRTGFKVSDIGAGAMYDEGVSGTAMDAGINYIDTAEQYPGHHKLVAEVLKGRDRKSIFITTKLQVKKDKSKQGFIKRTRKCLEEINTEYIDCLMMHMAETVDMLKTEGFHEAMNELKAEGRVRFVGVSNHGSFWFRDSPETMEKVLLAAAEDGRFDVFLMAYNFLKMDQSEKILQVCKEKKIGVAIMKSTPVAIYYSLKSRVNELKKRKEKVNPLYVEGLKRYKDKLDKAQDFIKKNNLNNPDEIKKAAVRFVLNNPNVGTVCCVARTYDELDQFIGLSGKKLSQLDKQTLSKYAQGCGDLYCRHACGICEPSCPQGVPVNTIMRYSHYFFAQGREQDAMRKYAAIPGIKAEVCGVCEGYCERACPYGVPVQGKLILAHDQLSVAG